MFYNIFRTTMDTGSFLYEAHLGKSQSGNMRAIGRTQSTLLQKDNNKTVESSTTTTPLVQEQISPWENSNIQKMENAEDNGFIIADQAQNVINYYRSRWSDDYYNKNEDPRMQNSNQNEYKNSVLTVNESTSLYSKLATKKGIKAYRSQSRKENWKSRAEQSILSSTYDQVKRHNHSFSKQPLLDYAPVKDGNYRLLRQSVSAPSFWALDRSPLQPAQYKDSDNVQQDAFTSKTDQSQATRMCAHGNTTVGLSNSGKLGGTTPMVAILSQNNGGSFDGEK